MLGKICPSKKRPKKVAVKRSVWRIRNSKKKKIAKAPANDDPVILNGESKIIVDGPNGPQANN